ncbi:hypothetical protein CRV24_005936 [Beauveria bassiana]|nr:hypothetical protein CRV24_005936 [Beauveria bassiana]
MNLPFLGNRSISQCIVKCLPMSDNSAQPAGKRNAGRAICQAAIELAIRELVSYNQHSIGGSPVNYITWTRTHTYMTQHCGGLACRWHLAVTCRLLPILELLALYLALLLLKNYYSK